MHAFSAALLGPGVRGMAGSEHAAHQPGSGHKGPQIATLNNAARALEQDLDLTSDEPVKVPSTDFYFMTGWCWGSSDSAGYLTTECFDEGAASAAGAADASDRPHRRYRVQSSS